MKKRPRPKEPPGTVDQQSVINTMASGLMLQWFASGWKLRPMNPDYHVDYLIERTEGKELTGQLIYVQQKGHGKISFKDGTTIERIKRKHLRYYAEKVELPVFVIFVDTGRAKAWFLFIQEWIDQNLDAKSLAGQGTIPVPVHEAQQLDDVPAFRSAVLRSLTYMKNKYPGSVLSAMSAEERRISALDPRFSVKMDVVGGKTTYHLLPKVDVTATIKVIGENAKLFQDHIETGRPISAGGGGMFITGLPAFTAQSPDGAVARMEITPGKPLEMQWAIWSDEASHPFRLTIDGTMTMGQKCYRFEGRLKGGPIKVEVRLPLAGDPAAGRADMHMSWDFGCWVGRPVLNLSHFEGIRAFVRRMQESARIRHEFNCDGRSLFPGELAFPKSTEPFGGDSIDFIHFARIAAAGFGVNPNLPKLSTLNVDDLAQVKMLADLVATGAHSRAGPGMKLNVTISNIIDHAEVLQRADDPQRFYRATRPNQMTRLLGESIEIGALEYTFAPATMTLSPEVRAGLRAGTIREFKAEVRGANDAVFTVKRVSEAAVERNDQA